MAETVISVENLSKLYRLGRAARKRGSLLSEAGHLLSSPFRNFRDLRRLDTAAAAAKGTESPDLLWALRDVSFGVERGEVLGVIGHNGAGKSTLLKIMSRVAEPTSGRIRIRGRVSSLLEVGTGFHPELTGRENVYLSGTILGMTKKEVDRKFDDIVAFSGVERFLDTAVKRYSSGMKVRLGFAVAAYLDPDVLIVDEVLAVGDQHFQAKCFNRIGELKRRGTTILLVSHNMHQILSTSNRVLLLDKGQVLLHGDPEPASRLYEEIMARDEKPAEADEQPKQAGTGRIRFESVRLVSDDGDPIEDVGSADPIVLEIRYDAEVDCPDAELDVVAYGNGNAMLFQATNRSVGQRIDIARGPGVLRVGWGDGLPVNNQRLFFATALWAPNRTELFDWRRGMILKVSGSRSSAGVLWSRCDFEAIPAAEAEAEAPGLPIGGRAE